MKNRKELLNEIHDENFKTLIVREIDMEYHKDILIPRYKKIKDKKIKKQKIEKGKQDMVAIKTLIGDLEGINKIVEKMIKDIK